MCVFLRSLAATAVTLVVLPVVNLAPQIPDATTKPTEPVRMQSDSGPAPRFPIVRDGKWGLIDAFGTVVVDPQFDDVAGCVSSGSSMAPKNAPQPVQDAGRLLDCGPVRTALIRVTRGGKWGAIDVNGQMVIPARFDEIKIWSEFIAAQRGDRWGFLDQKGEFRVSPQYDQVMPVGDLAAVRVDDKWALMDTTGAIVLPAQLDREPALFSDDEFVIGERDGRWGLLSKDGAWVVEPRFERIYRFLGGLGNATIDGKMGFIDSTGAWVIEPRFESATPFGPAGIAMVGDGDHKQYIDRQGKVVIDGDFFIAHPFDGTLARAAVGKNMNNLKWGYIGTDGNWVLQPVYDWVSTFHEGLAAVTKDDRTSYIDQDGNVVLELDCSGADFYEGRAGFVVKNKWGLMDRDGARVVESLYDRIYEFRYGLAKALLGDRIVYLDRDGNEVYDMEFPGFRRYVLIG